MIRQCGSGYWLGAVRQQAITGANVQPDICPHMASPGHSTVPFCFVMLWHGMVIVLSASEVTLDHDDVIKWKHFPRNWPFLRDIHRSSVNSPRKGRWRGALMFSLICVWINYWVNNREAGDLRCYRAHYDVTVMKCGGINQINYEFMI